MMSPKRSLSERLQRVFSPRGFLERAILYALPLLMLHLLGLRRYTSFLSGTLDAEGFLRTLSPVLGALYFVAYLLCTIVSPIFLLAAAILFTWNRLLSGRCNAPAL